MLFLNPSVSFSFIFPTISNDSQQLCCACSVIVSPLRQPASHTLHCSRMRCLTLCNTLCSLPDVAAAAAIALNQTSLECHTLAPMPNFSGVKHLQLPNLSRLLCVASSQAGVVLLNSSEGYFRDRIDTWLATAGLAVAEWTKFSPRCWRKI